MRNLRHLLYTVAALTALPAGASVQAASSHDDYTVREDYIHVSMPPGFQVVSTELDGPVFADAQGHTLYHWPVGAQRNGDAGEQKGKPSCADVKQTENAGLMSPYPGGLTLPDLDARPTCTDVWPPMLASDSDKAVGKWTIVNRPDGAKQWAYDGFALYRSVLDKGPGDVLGGVARAGRGGGGDGGSHRAPVGPPPNVPPAVAVYPVSGGRMLVTSDTKFALYAWDNDGANKSNCAGTCLDTWKPLLAPETAEAQGEWAIIERSPGVKQWTFRKKPLYSHIDDKRPHSLEGSDETGWRNVYTQLAPKAPGVFTTHDTTSGVVLADARGYTIYTYNCTDDATDQLACDNPAAEQMYRMAICGGGDADRCLKTFPYVAAKPDTKSGSHAWSVIDIDPKTGHFAAAGEADALHVWAYRGRPVYTFTGDRNPGDTMADGYGEFRGTRNGFKAFWIRDDFFGGFVDVG